MEKAGKSSLVDTRIRLNTVGFLENQTKKASIVVKCSNFAILLAETHAPVFSGTVTGPCFNHDTGEEIFTADFTALMTAGRYYLQIDNGAGISAPFEIGNNIYREPYRKAMSAMYLWRCGTSVSVNSYGHKACHLEDALLDYVGNPGVRKSSCGGWHDAGDYNKYVVNAGISVGMMFKLWDHFKDRIEHIDHIAQSFGDLPQFLQEIKWEIDWLFSMQHDDGSVFHKVSTEKFCGFIMPEDERSNRYFSPWGSSATADFTAMLAAASRVFRSYDINYADRCLNAAVKSYEFLLNNPQDHSPDLTGFYTGRYLTDDWDDRLWAVAELWEATGESRFLADFEMRAAKLDSKIDFDFNWSDLGNLGMLTYLFSGRSGRNLSLVDQIGTAVILTAEKMVETRDEHGYGRSLGSVYSWGANGNLLNQALVLQAAYLISSDIKYRDTILDALGFIFGRNCFCRSFVTTVGFNPPSHPHDRRSGADGIEEPWPGYLVGGPASNAKDYEDVESSCRTNEIAINWNAALIYALGAFV